MRFEIANVFNALAHMMEPSLGRWHALIHLDEVWKKRLSEYIGKRCITIDRKCVSYDATNDCFMYKNLGDPKWRNVCNSKGKRENSTFLLLIYKIILIHF